MSMRRNTRVKGLTVVVFLTLTVYWKLHGGAIPTTDNIYTRAGHPLDMKEMVRRIKSIDFNLNKTKDGDSDTALRQYNGNATPVTADIRTTPYNAYWVDGYTSFLQRIKLYNLALGNLRQVLLQKRANKSWTAPAQNPYVLLGRSETFFEQLSNFSHVNTMALSWMVGNSTASSNKQNLLIQEYYKWTASDPLCTWIRRTGGTKARYDTIYNRSCTTDLLDDIKPQDLETVYLNSKPVFRNHYWPNNGSAFPGHYYTTPPPHVLYMHVTEDAIISSIGDVFSGLVKLVPYTCTIFTAPSLQGAYMNTTLYSEVFIITGYWGKGNFHKNVELIPRIAPYLDFLVQHPGVRIQVSETTGRTQQILEMLGIRQDRLVSGPVRAHIAYLPQGTPCGFGQVQELQILSKLYSDHIAQMNINSTGTRKLIMIHRSGRRKLLDADHIEALVRDLAEEYDLEFHVFHDKHLPSLQDTMVLFNQAALVVAPHGAGGLNLLFCRQGTFYVELVCNRPHVNLCYQRLAHVTGLRYHAIPSERGCEQHITVNPKLIEFVLRVKLEQWRMLRPLGHVA